MPHLRRWQQLQGGRPKKPKRGYPPHGVRFDMSAKTALGVYSFTDISAMETGNLLFDLISSDAAGLDIELKRRAILRRKREQ